MKSTYLLLILCLSFIGHKVHATHLVGSDLQVFATSTPYQYNVRLTVYRDCEGIPMCNGSCSSASCDQIVSVTGLDGSCSGSTLKQYVLSYKSVADSKEDLNPKAKSLCDNLGCATPGSLTPAIEKYIFEGLISLHPDSFPSGCSRLSISWNLCCRNGIISSGSAGEGFYTEVIVDRTIPNSTPLFQTDPFFIACGAQPYIYNIGAWDADGDSLSFAFVPSLQDANTPVDYIPPYSYKTPMPWRGPANGTFPLGISCDPATGDVMFTPINGGSGIFVGILAIGVTEWRTINGTVTKVGESRRDVQGWVIACNNSFPRFVTDPNSNSASYNWTVCEGSTLCFDLIAKDSNLTDSTFLTFDTLLVNKGATFTPKNNPRQREDAYTFCWAPPAGTSRDMPYTFYAKAKDNHIGFIGKVIRSFSILVLDTNNKPVLSGDTIAEHGTTKIYSVLNRHKGSTWQWFVGGGSLDSTTSDSLIVQWGNGDSGVVKVVEVTSSGCVSDTAYLPIQLIISTGLEDLQKLNTIQWYPVPAKDVLYFTSSDSKIKQIRLYNLEGKELMSFGQEDILKRELSLKNIVTGIYLLKVETAENSLTKKISIIK